MIKTHIFFDLRSKDGMADPRISYSYDNSVISDFCVGAHRRVIQFILDAPITCFFPSTTGSFHNVFINIHKP